MTDPMCQKWFLNFHAADFSMDDAPQSGRPVKVDSDQIKTLTGNSRHYTMQKIAVILKISKLIMLLVKNEKCVLFYGKKNTDFSANPI